MGFIHPKALQSFINDPREDHTWLKTKKHKELNQALSEIGFELDRCEERLDKHQKVCVLLGIAYKAFAFWLDMGTGKTRVALELLRYWMKVAKEAKVALVVAPSETVLIGWENQIKRWKINIPFITLPNSSSQEKWDQIAEFDKGIILATFPGVTRMVSKMGKTGKGKNKLKLHPTLVKRFCSRIDALVMDESTLCANKGSLNWRFCNQVSKYAAIRYQLAGRPFGSNPEGLWAQLYLIDKGETLGSTLGIFRTAFYTENHNHWGGTEYVYRRELDLKLRRILRHRSIEYSEAETGTVHELRNQTETVFLPQEAKAYYEQKAKQVMMQQLGLSERKNAFIRMRQISSGFVGFTDDETGKKAEIAFATNPKLDRLIELIKEMPKDRKFVIFHEFVYSGLMISKALTKMGIQHGCLNGATEDGRGIRKRFGTDSKYRGLVINHKVGAYGTDGLQEVANYCFIYEAPVPPIDNEQMRKRLARKGQKRTVHEYDLVVAGTVDIQILDAHKRGENLFKKLIRSRGK